MPSRRGLTCFEDPRTAYVTVSDLDGLEQVICAYNLYGEDGALLTQSVVQAGPEGAFVNVSFTSSCADASGTPSTRQSSPSLHASLHRRVSLLLGARQRGRGRVGGPRVLRSVESPRHGGRGRAQTP